MIVVTGAKGFIGKNLVNNLKNQNKDVVEIDFTEKDYLSTYYYHDFKCGLIERVYHLGAISSTTETNIDLIYENNIKYTLNLFEQCIDFKVPVSYASSASVYGNSSDYSINPLNYYALSKATIDLWVEDNISRFTDIKGYRFFNVYGKDEDHKGSQASPVHSFIKQARETGIVKVFDTSGDGMRDFICVDDVCRIMLNDQRAAGIYDVGTGVSVSFSRLGAVIASAFGARIEVIPFPDHLTNKYQFHTKARQPDIKCIKVLDYIKDIASQSR